jgi:hypothetical protein
MAAMPDLPATSDDQYSALFWPIAVTAPTPVTTTRGRAIADPL